MKSLRAFRINGCLKLFGALATSLNYLVDIDSRGCFVFDSPLTFGEIYV